MAAAALLLASCGYGVTGPAYVITPISAQLNGDATNTVRTDEIIWFEYGTTDTYGSSTTPEQVYNRDVNVSQNVWQNVTGLTDDTTYHYRLCVEDTEGRGACGSDKTFTTPAGDSVQGDGLIATIPSGFPPGSVQRIGGTVTAWSNPDGSDPDGSTVIEPHPFGDSSSVTGTVTCLKVVGNRAAIGMQLPPAIYTGPPRYAVAFVEDNGPTGDRWAVSAPLAAPGTTCPTPTAADFPPVVIAGTDYGSTLTSGDFTVHDHP